jgi:hypothetical protein
MGSAFQYAIIAYFNIIPNTYIAHIVRCIRKIVEGTATQTITGHKYEERRARKSVMSHKYCHDW